VNNQKELLPRQALVSGFFAMRAGVAESVVVGSITADKLGAASITTEKVAAGAVTGDKLAASVITTDKIANGAVTQQKLSADVQQKLAQSGSTSGSISPDSSPTVKALTVKQRIKIGLNSLYLGMEDTGQGNAIWTTPPDGVLSNKLRIQSNRDHPTASTIINNNGPLGRVGIGTDDPKAKLDVAGMFLVSPAPLSMPSEGLHMFYTTTNVPVPTAEIGAYNGSYQKLTITGNPLILNDGDTSAGVARNVGIGTTTPKNKLDVAGSVAIGSGYAGTKTAPANGLIVEGKVAIGRSDIDASYYDPASTVSINGSVGLTGNDHFRIGPWDMWQTTVSNGSSLYIDRLSGRGNGTYVRETMCRFGWDKSIHCSGGFYNDSDRRIKDDIRPIEDSLSKVSKLQGVSYLLKTEISEEKVSITRKIGFIAQEVEPILPELVSTDEKGFKGVAYDKMTAVLVEAVKELKGQNEALKAIVCKDHPRELICQ